MQQRGLLPDFPDAALKEAEALEFAAKPSANAQDMRKLSWISIDNDDSKDLDQITFAESLANGEYARAKDGMTKAEGDLNSLQDGSQGPTMTFLATARGEKPVEQKPAAPAILNVLGGEPAKLDMMVLLKLTPTQEQITQTKNDLLRYEAERDLADSKLNGPDGLYQQRARIVDAIKELTRLRDAASTSEVITRD